MRPAAPARAAAGSWLRARLRVEDHQAGRRLDALLEEWLAGVLGRPPGRAGVRRALMAGAVRVAGRPCRRPGYVPAIGSELHVNVDPRRLEPEGLERARRAAATGLHVLHADTWLLAVDKPAGLPTHAGADARCANLVELVREHLARLDGRPAAQVYLGVHQRLDRDTSGVVLFALDPAANPALAAQFREHRVDKRYLALVVRPARLPPRRFTLAAPVVHAGRAQPARTQVRLVQVLSRGLLVEARPLSGRKHQVRIHLAQAGLPILGDRRYGGPAGVPRLMLHAASLQLEHPRDRRPLRLEASPPQDFRRALNALGARPTPGLRRSGAR